MFRLRDAVAAVALASCGIGCATFCDECDDFPVPGRYAALPGSYTGPPLDSDGPRHGRQFDMPSPTATQESGTTPAPAAPSSDDGSGPAAGGGVEAATPPPPVPPAGTPFAPAGEAATPELP